MNHLSIGTAYGQSSRQHIPTEVCEIIIDMLYSYFVSDTAKNIATLHSCTLVCRDWRVRAQKTLFYKVQLSDQTSFRSFSVVLDVAPHLRGYVHEVTLTGYYLHTTASTMASFPAVFAGRLPSLREIKVHHLPETETWLSRTLDLDPPTQKLKSLDFIPLHPGFPALLSSFTAVSFLSLDNTTFYSFSQFARVVHGLPNLESLACNSVHWITAGGSHPGADFTKRSERGAGGHNPQPFAPRLRELWVWDMALYGAEKLISARGSYLTILGMTMPLSDSDEDLAKGGALDLSSCTHLRHLVLQLTPGFSANMQSAVRAFKYILNSWRPPHRSRLEFSAYDYPRSTRREFANVLRTIGPITDAWIRGASSAGDTKEKCLKHLLVICIHDWEVHRQWWSDCVKSCFPAWARLKRLYIRFLVSSYHQWADEK